MTNHTNITNTTNSSVQEFIIQPYTVNTGYDLIVFVFLSMLVPLLCLWYYEKYKESFALYIGLLVSLVGGVIVLISSFHPFFFMVQLGIIVLLLIKVVDAE